MKNFNEIFRKDVAYDYINPKTAGGTQFDTPPCGFSKNVSSKERVKPCFFCDF